MLEVDHLFRIQRRQVVEQRDVLGYLRLLVVDRFDLQQSEIPLVVLGRTHLSSHRVAGLQVELLDLRRREVDVVRAGQIVEFVRTQETVPFRQYLENTFGIDQPVFLGLVFEDFEDEFALAERGNALNVHFVGDIDQFGDVHLLQFLDVHGSPLNAGNSCRGSISMTVPQTRCERTRVPIR